MSKKATITDEMIVNAAFDITREEGAECVNARSIAKRIGCTTQPVLYHFSTIMEIKEAVFKKADAFHSEYISDIRGRYENPMLEIGMRYIRFAAEEKNLFRLLFQSDKYSEKDVESILNAEELAPIFKVISAETGTDENKAREIFSCLFFPVHGFASFIANNSMEYSEEYIANILGMICEISLKKGE